MRTRWMIASLLAGCGQQLTQVPADQPHGVVQFRVVHQGAQGSFEDQVRLDAETMELGKRHPEPTLRVRPGLHYVELISRRIEWQHSFETVDLPRRSCGDILCTPQPLNEVRSVIRPNEDAPVCQGTFDLDVRSGSQQVALLIVSADGRTCNHCLSEDRTARACP